MAAKEELQRLIETLSDYECGHLLSSIQDVVSGERFWEGDVGIHYNEYVKARYFNIGRNTSSIVPAAPDGDSGVFAPVPVVKSRKGERRELPSPPQLGMNLGDVLTRRRSRRDYSGGPISIEHLSSLLHYGCGTTGFVSGYGYDRLPVRTFPSSGGLQSPEVYVSVQAVDGVRPGLYHYHPVDHALEMMKTGSQGETLRNLALGQIYVERAAVVFLITGCYDRLRWKYGERGYRYMCMDAGFLAENLYLAGEAFGLGLCAIAGFVDDSIEELLEIDGQDEVALLLLTVGTLSPPTSTDADVS